MRNKILISLRIRRVSARTITIVTGNIPPTVDDITANAIKASFCIITCSEDAMATIGASAPLVIIFCETSVLSKENGERRY